MSWCLPGGLVGGPVVFDYGTWSLRYPEFTQTVNAGLAQLYFDEACMFLENSACSRVIDNRPGGERAMLLNMLVAHIAALNAGTNGSAASALVGRISGATQGTVSVRTDMGSPGSSAGSAAWYQQTKYGAAFWQTTAGFRLGGRYKPGPQPYFGVNRPFGPYSG